MTPSTLRRILARHLGDSGLRLWLVAVIVFLYTPIVGAVVWAFNDGVLGKQSGRFTGFTTAWFGQAWQDGQLRHAVGISLRAGLIVAVVSTVIGTISGLALARSRIPFLRRLLEGQVYLLLIVPEIVLGVALLIFFTKIHARLGLGTLVLGHTLFPIAVVSMVVRSRVLALRLNLEDAAADLGAVPWRAFWDIVVPQLQPALLASLILSFTFSFDDVVTSLFLSTPTVNTLPVTLYGSLHAGVTPVIYALAAMMIAFTLAMLAFGFGVYLLLARRAGATAAASALVAPSRVAAPAGG